MSGDSFFGLISDCFLFAACLFILLGSIFITIKTRFVQIRFIPALLKNLRNSFITDHGGHHQTILPHRALFTAMSTTLGISTIVGPVIAINLGGPGALLGFLLTAFFGSAATFVEVNLCIKHRKKSDCGRIHGGPMQYLQHIFSPGIGKWYAIGCCLLMTVWSGAQANQLAAILDSPLLGDYRVPTFISGIILSILVILTLIGGIKRISALSSKLVPLMFVLYVGSSLWIILSDMSKLGFVFQQIFESALSPHAMANGALVGGIFGALRWGVFKGTQATEAGIGTQTIAHSMAHTEDSTSQGMLAMLSTYTTGFVAFLSGTVTLVTQTWNDTELPLGISMVAASFNTYFSTFGIAIIAISAFLFAYGTILGNSYNGSQCFGFLTKNKKISLYYLITAVIIFFGTVGGVKTIWSSVDLVLVGIAVPHMAALIWYTHKKSKELHVETNTTILENSEYVPLQGANISAQ